MARPFSGTAPLLPGREQNTQQPDREHTRHVCELAGDNDACADEAALPKAREPEPMHGQQELSQADLTHGASKAKAFLRERLVSVRSSACACMPLRPSLEVRIAHALPSA